MELHIIAVILIVFLFSLGSLLFISKLPKGKTFDEMLAEKKHLKQQLLAAQAQSGSTKGGKKTGSKNQKKQKPLKGKAAQKVQESDNATESDSDDSSEASFNNMEFMETEQFNLLSQQKRQSKNQPPKKTATVGGKAKSGILTNKAEVSPVVATNEVVVAEINHFEQTQPKDVMAMRAEKEEEEKLQTKPVKEVKKNKPQNTKKEKEQTSPPLKQAPPQPKVSPPISPKTVQPVRHEKPLPQREEKPKPQETVKVEEVKAAPVEAVAPVKEKINKKKKVESVASGKGSKLISAHEDEQLVNTLIHTIGHTELTHNEIQLLIEFLLNKQQDTISKDPTEWTEGKSDVMQKLKKQLQECGKQLLDEKQAAVAFQNKLRELRAEMNNDKMLYSAQTKAYMEQINIKTLDIQTMNNDIKNMTDKFTNEKQQLIQQYQQLQGKLIQLNSKEATNQLEFGQQIQQLKDTNTLLQQDLANKNKMVAEMQIFAKQNSDTMHKMGEFEQKFQDYEMMLRKKDEHIGFLQHDLHGRDDEIHRLNGELQRQKEEFDRAMTQQLGDLQAKQQAAAAANHHDEESSKVEIKNLQNALDSTRTELNSAKNGSEGFKQQVDDLQAHIGALKAELGQVNLKRTEQNDQKVTEFNKMVATFETQIKELKSNEDQIKQQLEEQKTKNNDLRTKNWKLIEEIQLAPTRNANKKPTDPNNLLMNNEKVHLQQTQQPKIDVDQIVLDEQNRTKALFTKILPDLPNGPSDYNKWIEHVSTYIKTQLTTNSSSVVDNNLNNSTSTTTTTTTYKINSHNNGNGGADDDEEITSSGDLSTLLIKNVELQQVVDEYKNNLAKAYQMLDSLQSKADEQDRVVLAKERELMLLKKITTNNVSTEQQQEQES